MFLFCVDVSLVASLDHILILCFIYFCLPQYFWLFQVLEAFRLAMLIIMAQMFVIIIKKLISRVSGSDLHLAWFVDEF